MDQHSNKRLFINYLQDNDSYLYSMIKNIELP